MKHILLISLLILSIAARGQKYALLDETLVQPVKYTNVITSADKFNNFFPIEKKVLPEFIKALKDIDRKLASGNYGKLQQYEMGCVKFTGGLVFLPEGQRMDYVITSSCNNIKISMHLCNPKKSNSSNAFFIKTWIKYIENK